ncbi:sulfatase-like hydrolase/transferase (plasmid) [Verrucomicrobiaceae bacterium 227]
MKNFLITTFTVAFSTACSLGAEPHQKNPNIVFIMADDLGPGWVDYDDSNPEVNTPNLQRLAESGMVFTKAYAACPVCSPTRAACLTGMSPAQIGMTTHIPGKAGNERRLCLRATQVLV